MHYMCLCFRRCTNLLKTGCMRWEVLQISLISQYCMAWPRHFLQGSSINRVTQIRVSGDYQPGNTQWRIGDTTILAEALGISAFKDVSVLTVSYLSVTHTRTHTRARSHTHKRQVPLTVFFTYRTFTLYLMRRSVSSRIPNLIPSWKQCLLLWLLVH